MHTNNNNNDDNDKIMVYSYNNNDKLCMHAFIDREIVMCIDWCE